MELNLKSGADLAKLEGWTIKKASFQGTENTDPEIVLRVEHPAAARPVQLTIKGTMGLSRSGNVVLANSVLHVKTEDIYE